MTMEPMSGPQRPRGWWYPYIFVGAFAVVLAVNAALYYFASSTFTGLFTDKAYEKGLAYNDALAAEEAQRRLGWTVEAEVTPGPAEAGRRPADLAVRFADRDGRPVGGLTVSALLRRPTQAGHDLRVELRSLGPGRYGAPVVLPLPGQWDLQVVATGGPADYRLNRRITLP
jgi:nitrogen fixation protein FixH